MNLSFQSLFVDPLAELLRVLYASVAFQDLGVAIIVLTVLVRLVLHPLFHKSMRQQAVMRELQPEVRRIQEQHKNNREAQGRALMDLYRARGINPFSGVLVLIIQLPILIALYQVFLRPLPVPNPSLLGLINLAEPSMLLVAVAAVAQYISGAYAVRQAPAGEGREMARRMALLFPIITILALYALPAAVGVYWVATTVFSVAQQAYAARRFAPGA
jgi:YidC/Oxa1 family membrane protein insertase